jgi:4'-phosphopantetheinyl transferase
MEAVPPAPGTLQGPGPDEVHVWSLALDTPPLPAARLAGLLAGDERERAQRFRSELDRTRYVAGRGQLRVLLGGYLGLDPGAVAFSYGEHGKPAVRSRGLDFNMARSGGLAVVAVTAGLPVGIDVERVRAGVADASVAEHFFSPDELAALRRLPGAARDRAFLACWTRKEAFLKGRGSGVSVPLDAFCVSLAPDEEPAVVWSELSPSDPWDWWLEDLSVWFPGHVAAVAVAGRGAGAERRARAPGHGLSRGGSSWRATTGAAGASPPPAAPAGADRAVKVRRRRLLDTTNTLENAMAAPAIMGLRNPAAASGRAATL